MRLINAKFLKIGFHVSSESVFHVSLPRCSEGSERGGEGVHMGYYKSLIAATIPFFDADQAGKNPPRAPIRVAKSNPPIIATAPT